MNRLLMGCAIAFALATPAFAQPAKQAPEISTPQKKQGPSTTRSDEDDASQSGPDNAQSGAEYDAYGVREGCTQKDVWQGRCSRPSDRAIETDPPRR